MTIAIYIDPNVLTSIDAIAKQELRSRSQMITMLLRKAAQEYETHSPNDGGKP